MVNKKPQNYASFSYTQGLNLNNMGSYTKPRAVGKKKEVLR